jgi:hypothetical protein
VTQSTGVCTSLYHKTKRPTDASPHPNISSSLASIFSLDDEVRYPRAPWERAGELGKQARPRDQSSFLRYLPCSHLGGVALHNPKFSSAKSGSNQVRVYCLRCPRVPSFPLRILRNDFAPSLDGQALFNESKRAFFYERKYREAVRGTFEDEHPAPGPSDARRLE